MWVQSLTLESSKTQDFDTKLQVPHQQMKKNGNSYKCLLFIYGDLSGTQSS